MKIEIIIVIILAIILTFTFQQPIISKSPEINEGAKIAPILDKCPGYTFMCKVGKLSACCPGKENEQYTCKNIIGNPYCNPINKNTCDKEQTFCKGSNTNRCCDSKKEKCNTFHGYATCDDKNAGNCLEGQLECGNQCCSLTQECKKITKFWATYKYCSDKSCQKDEELCPGEKINICCPTGECVTTGGTPMCIPNPKNKK